VNDIDTAEFHEDIWNCYLMLGFVLAHIPWNATSKLEFQWSYNALQSVLVLPSTRMLNNICQREHKVTVDGIMTQLPSRNDNSFALDGWTSTNILAIMSSIACYLDRNWAMRDVQLAFDEVHSLFISYFKPKLRVMGQGSTCYGVA